MIEMLLIDIELLIFEMCQERGVEAEFVVVKDRPSHLLPGQSQGFSLNKVLDVRIGVKGRVSRYGDCQYLTLEAGRDIRRCVLDFLIRYDFV